MKRRYLSCFALIFVFLVGVVYGMLLKKYRLFPYDSIRWYYTWWIRKTPDPKPSYGPWAIGIYGGSGPFELAPSLDVENPVLTGKDATDVDGVFMADPFLVRKDGKFFMFFEVLNRKSQQGDIAFAESKDGYHWSYRQVVIDEPYHLSYPQVFEWKSEFYLIPESYENLSIRIYKANRFPDKWEYLGNAIAGFPFVDSTIFRHDDKWWIFTTFPENDLLYLYYSDQLLGEWTLHPKSPLVKFNKHFARPAGSVIRYRNHLYRFAQDDSPKYGLQVFAFEITELTENSYAEKMVSEKPIIGFTGKGWNSHGMHQLDLLEWEKGWLGAVDGKNR